MNSRRSRRKKNEEEGKLRLISKVNNIQNRRRLTSEVKKKYFLSLAINFLFSLSFSFSKEEKILKSEKP